MGNPAPKGRSPNSKAHPIRKAMARSRKKPQSDPSHPRRKSPRHPAFDYRSCAAYFVTINAYRGRHLFGRVVEGRMQLSPDGEIVREEWCRSEVIRETIVLDDFVVMPNHFHGIVCIVDPGVTHVSPDGYEWQPRWNRRAPWSRPGGRASAKLRSASLGAMVNAFKGAVTRRVRERRGVADFRVWHGRYHDTILRTEQDWRIRRRYVALNPVRWGKRRR
jgi:REP element-mobilizing transposase RayT